MFAQSDPLAETDTADVADAQPKVPFKDRLVYGGNVGVSFGTITVLNLSPQVGYKFTERIIGGVGCTYLYYNDAQYAYSTSVYGGRVFGQYLFTRALFGYAEAEVLNGSFDAWEPTRRFNVTSLLAGAGYFYQIGGGLGFYGMALWNFNDSRYSPHGPNPVLRGGFSLGL